jgi:hypothetical protein
MSSKVARAPMTASQWLQFARTPRLPPMPWFNLRYMSDDDLRSIYRFVRDLGPQGERAPMAAGPGQPVATPFIVFEPRVEQMLSRTKTSRSKCPPARGGRETPSLLGTYSAGADVKAVTVEGRTSNL